MGEFNQTDALISCHIYGSTTTTIMNAEENEFINGEFKVAWRLK